MSRPSVGYVLQCAVCGFTVNGPRMKHNTERMLRHIGHHKQFRSLTGLPINEFDREDKDRISYYYVNVAPGARRKTWRLGFVILPLSLNPPEPEPKHVHRFLPSAGDRWRCACGAWFDAKARENPFASIPAKSPLRRHRCQCVLRRHSCSHPRNVFGKNQQRCLRTKAVRTYEEDARGQVTYGRGLCEPCLVSYIESGLA
jgi:hypothetical protein